MMKKSTQAEYKTTKKLITVISKVRISDTLITFMITKEISSIKCMTTSSGTMSTTQVCLVKTPISKFKQTASSLNLTGRR